MGASYWRDRRGRVQLSQLSQLSRRGRCVPQGFVPIVTDVMAPACPRPSSRAESDVDDGENRLRACYVIARAEQSDPVNVESPT